MPLGPVLHPTVPTPVMSTQLACHMRTPAILLEHNAALGTPIRLLLCHIANGVPVKRVAPVILLALLPFMPLFLAVRTHIFEAVVAGESHAQGRVQGGIHNTDAVCDWAVVHPFVLDHFVSVQHHQVLFCGWYILTEKRVDHCFLLLRENFEILGVGTVGAP
jgi:hypothetical protein